MDSSFRQDQNVDSVLRKAVAYFSIGNTLRKKGHALKAIEAYEKALSVAPDQAPIHHNLGLTHLKEGSFFKAIQCFLKAITIDPHMAQAHHNLGITYKQLENFTEAIKAYETAIDVNHEHCQLKAASFLNLAAIYKQMGQKNLAVMHYQKAAFWDASLKEEVEYMLAAMGEGEVQSAPNRYIQRLFDQYADDYDRHMIKKLHYRAPACIARALLNDIESYHVEQRPLKIIVDAGCGSGLCAPLLRSLSSKLIGIDLSEQMLQKASTLGLYDELIQDDLQEALHNLLRAKILEIEAIVAADVFNYVGQLEQVFQLAFQLLLGKGPLIFTIEASESYASVEERGFYLKDTARFVHRLDYIRQALLVAGFKKIEEKSCILRYEKCQPVWAWLIRAR